MVRPFSVSKTKIVGILNITPDSFSDGGEFNSTDSALNQLKKLVEDGADIIDIGAESTRPNAKVISVKEEWHRLQNILPACVNFVKNYAPEVQISVDTRNFQNAKKSYEFGVQIINDVSGLQDKEMIRFLAKNRIKTILMHSLCVPADSQIIIDKNLDVVDEIIGWAKDKIMELLQEGFVEEQIIFDVGIGFGKDSAQSIEILKRIDEFKKLNLPLYVGHSRKRFLNDLTFAELQKFDFDFTNYCDFDDFDRDKKTAIVTKYLMAKNIDFIRIHNLKEYEN